MIKQNVIGFLWQDFLSWLEANNEPTYRARQITAWIYKKQVTRFEEMSNLPVGLRQRLAEEFQIGTMQVAERRRSADGTEKFLFSLPDASAVESVFIPHRERSTFCLSSQVGCPVGCLFCATGKAGFRRNLTFQEIVEEVWWMEKICGVSVHNLVFMGMGEPLLNYDQLSRALRVINAREGLGIGSRRITISTVGIPENIVRLGREWPEINLAVSLHAPDDELRSSLVPLNRAYPLSLVLKSIREYIKLTNRRVTVEYTLWQDINDGAREAYGLARLVKGMLVHVNLIPGNQIEDSSFSPVSSERIERFARILRENQINVTVRRSRGQEIQASCGELYRIWEGEK